MCLESAPSGNVISLEIDSGAVLQQVRLSSDASEKVIVFVSIDFGNTGTASTSL
jgi:hypothetical protein